MRHQIIHPPDSEGIRRQALAYITRDLSALLLEARNLDVLTTADERAAIFALAARVVMAVDPDTATHAQQAAAAAVHGVLLKTLDAVVRDPAYAGNGVARAAASSLVSRVMRDTTFQHAIFAAYDEVLADAAVAAGLAKGTIR
jgi:hypothetical protein